MKINNEKLVKRWNNVMNDIGCEYLTIGESLSELDYHKTCYGIEKGISVEWMLKEAKYQLSCYFEDGNIRRDDRNLGKEEYKVWLSESGKLKRLVERLKKESNAMVVEW